MNGILKAGEPGIIGGELCQIVSLSTGGMGTRTKLYIVGDLPTGGGRRGC